MEPFDETPSGGAKDKSRALLEQANDLFKAGRFKASEVTFKRVIDLGSDVAEGFYGVGVVRLSRNDQAAAEANFRSALEHDPWHANALYQLGLMAEQGEDLEEARSYYRKALASKPEHVGAQKRLARLSDPDPQEETPSDTNDYDRGGERPQDTMIVEFDTPVELVVEDSRSFVAGSRFSVNKETTSIGRSSASDIDLEDDETASRVHAQLTRHGEQLYVEDLGSTNGTYVNGERIIGVVELGLGDELRVGITSLRRVDSDTSTDASTDSRIRPAASADTNSDTRPEGITDNQATTNEGAITGVESASTKWGQVALALLLPALLGIATDIFFTMSASTLYGYSYIFWIISLLSCGFWAGLAWLGRSFKVYVLLGLAEGVLGFLIDSPFPPPVEANILGFAAPTLIFLSGALFADLRKKKNLPPSEREFGYARTVAKEVSGSAREPNTRSIPLIEKLAPFVTGLVGLIAAWSNFS
jgi:pSer/pThr/pTyr-binding forkhead associated (FHA) protein